MQFVSTQAKPSDEGISTSDALMKGLADDGHLFVPRTFPRHDLRDFDGLETMAQIGERLLTPFFDGDRLQPRLREICEEAFNFEIPLKSLTEDTAVLELFHGPTAAFKDVGARFLASCLSRLQEGQQTPLTILVATSGDTGGAVAAAFHQKPNVEVIILYPKGGVSARQERQLTCWQDNIRTFAVHGVFDDCQRLVKGAFAHSWWQNNKRLSSANSINIGRLLPQMVYYAASSIWYMRRHGVKPNYIIPSGNVGNVCACIWAKQCGLPIGNVIMATNENATITDYLITGEYAPRPSVATLASAMDVGNPSNMERIRHLMPDIEELRQNVRAYKVTDAQIRRQIKLGTRVWGEVWCPHTACGVEVREQLDEANMVIVATAHPAKFDIIVEPLIESTVPIPENLAKLLHAPNYALELHDPNLEAFTGAVAEQLDE